MKMSSSGLCSLRARVKERLTAAAEDIFELFERSIAEYVEEVRRLKRRNCTQLRRLEQAGLREEAVRRRPEAERREEEQSFGIKQEGVWVFTQEETVHIKEELEDDQLQELPFTPVCVKTEDNEDKSCVCHHGPAASNTEECGAEREEDQLKGADSEGTDLSEDWTREQPVGPDSSVCDAGGKPKPYSCSECGKRFVRKAELQRHMPVHTGLRPFACSLCQKGFTQKINLKRHMRTHGQKKRASPKRERNPRKHTCSDCGKCFQRNAELKRHAFIHTGQRPFSCSVCTKSFSQKSHLKQHTATHTGERPYSCLVCHKGFTDRGNLNTHMRTHTGDRPYSCPFCQRGFTQNISLRRHIRFHTGSLDEHLQGHTRDEQLQGHTGEEQLQGHTGALGEDVRVTVVFKR